MYTIRSTITDDDGGVLKVPGVLVVVYDTRGGTARGDGSVGPDHFDFTVSYPSPSATEPVGTVNVCLPPNLRPRHHPHLDSLVVTPPCKGAYTGAPQTDPYH